jgi:tRNA A-37 threonylcarbamoyl transferase component Bud32
MNAGMQPQAPEPLVTTITCEGIVWTARCDLDPAIIADVWRKLHAGRSCPGLRLIKDNNVRSAFLCATGNRLYPEIFIKRYKCRGLSDVLKYRIVPAKVVSEWQNLRAFEARGIACPAPLAYTARAAGPCGREGLLITASLNPALTLDAHAGTMQPGDVSGRRQLLRQLAALIRDLHHQRVFYRDLHAGNLLVRTSDGGPELFLIDLHKARVMPFLPQWMRVRDLAQLCNSLTVSQAERLAFLRQYCSREPDPEASLRSLRPRIASKAARLERQRVRSRSKRCLINSSVFEVFWSWHERYCGRKNFGKAAAAEALQLHAAARRTEEAAVKASSKSVLTVHALKDNVRVCVKGYRFLGIPYALKNLLRRTRALKSWIAANGLMVRGVDTPLPLAVLERRWGPFVRESFYITSWLDAARPLNTYIQTTAGLSARQPRAAFITACALAIRKLHAGGIYHADLKSNNILVTERGDCSWGFSFVDLDRVVFRRRLSFQQQANNLAQINASVSASMTLRDRLMFFRVYARETSWLCERRRYYKKILQISRTKNTKPYGIEFDHGRAV